MRNISLSHHGIKGMKWGVWNDETRARRMGGHNIMPKGTVLNSVTKSPKPEAFLRRKKWSGRPVYTYNPENQWDAKVYKGPYSAYLIKVRGANIVNEMRFKTLKDLSMPTKQERLDNFIKLGTGFGYKSDLKSTLSDQKDKCLKYGIASTPKMLQAIKDLDVKNIDWGDKKQVEVAYELFNRAMQFPENNASTAKYLRTMRSKYDAMVDDNNKDIYNNVVDPVMVFRANKVLEYEGSTPLSALDINSNIRSVVDKLSSEGKRVKL